MSQSCETLRRQEGSTWGGQLIGGKITSLRCRWICTTDVLRIYQVPEIVLGYYIFLFYIQLIRGYIHTDPVSPPEAHELAEMDTWTNWNF